MLGLNRTSPSKRTNRASLFGVGVPAILCALLTAAPAYADLIGDLGLTDAANFTVFGFAGGSSSGVTNDSNVTVNGNQAIAPNATLSIQAPSTVTGNVYTYNTSAVTGPGAVGGSVIVDATRVTNASNAVNSGLSI